mmetsp:Transcript_69630/g.112230  ORF Transcript_69630/g.112230 Transcript_69630/m.112230 type:complete len:462 (+) Transcript_69630:73-1458(+)
MAARCLTMQRSVKAVGTLLVLSWTLATAGPLSPEGPGAGCDEGGSGQASCLAKRTKASAASSSLTSGVLLVQRRFESSIKGHNRIADAGQEDSECCDAFQNWPNVDQGVVCNGQESSKTGAGCKALVQTAPYGHRCDKYCESFGHVCVAAAEEVNEDCRELYAASCDQEIRGTSDMLCTCMKPAAPKTCSAWPAAPKEPIPGTIGWKSSGHQVGQGWCAEEEPHSDWDLRMNCPSSGLSVKVLTYNLFWWNLFDRRKGNGQSAGKLISENGQYDMIAFQECDDVWRVLGDAGLASTFTPIDGGHAIALAYRTAAWERLSDGKEEIAEDSRAQYYGKRSVVWARLRNVATGKVVFYLNHHGPLPVNSGGACGGQATAYRILKTVGLQAHGDDLIVVVGDFNAGPDSDTVKALQRKMNLIVTGRKLGAVDHIFSNCGGASVKKVRNLGDGGSDHDALDVTFEF